MLDLLFHFQESKNIGLPKNYYLAKVAYPASLIEEMILELLFNNHKKLFNSNINIVENSKKIQIRISIFGDVKT
jgi:hypothetical protein